MSKILDEIKESPALCVLLLVFVIALARLAYMQVWSHKDYDEFYAERFGDSLPVQSLGDVIDRNGQKILSQSLDIDLEVDYSTSSIAALSYEQNMSCNDKGGKLKQLLFSDKYKYIPDCNAFMADNYGNAIIGIDKFRQDNQWLNLEDKNKCKDRKKTSKRDFHKCKDIDFADYRSAQRKLERLFELRRQIFGFKFTNPGGTLGKICSTAYIEPKNGAEKYFLKTDKELKEQLADIIVNQLDLSKYEEDTLSENDKNKTVAEYCTNYSDITEIGIVLSEVYEKNIFTPQLLDDAVSAIALENKQGEDNTVLISSKEKFHVLFCEDNSKHKLCKEGKNNINFDEDSAKEVVLSKNYCEGKYNSRLCRKLYEHNLDSIADFFIKESSLSADSSNIASKIKAAKTSFPHSAIIISAQDKKNITQAYPRWKWKNFKHIKDYYITETANPDEYKFDKGKFRKKFTDYGGINRIKNQDKIFAKVMNRKEDNYISLAKIPKNEFNRALPDVNYYNGAYSLNGIDFLIGDRYSNMFKISENTDNRDNAPADYMLEHYLQTSFGGENILQLAYKPYLRGGSDIEKIPGAAAKHIKTLKKGDPVQLTIDARIQMFADLALRRQCEQMKADRGFLLVQNVHTGEMLAISEYSADPIINIQGKREPKEFKGDLYRKWINGDAPLSLNKIYKPGSTFKPFAAAFALEGGFISKDSSFKIAKEYVALKNSDDETVSKAWCGIHEEGYKTKDKQCDKNDTTYIRPDLDYSLDEIIARSSNVGISLAVYEGWKKGKSDYMEEMAKKFGFMTKTGLGEDANVPESAGKSAPLTAKDRKGNTVPLPQSEILKDYLKKSYGQGGLEISPVALINAYSALVNGGLLPKPHIVMQKKSPKSERVISQETSEQARKWMYAVLQPGDQHTGQNLHLENAGGKSGTGDMVNKPGANLASFAAFYPNSADGLEVPNYVVLAIIDENKYGSHAQGAKASGPLAKDVIEKMRELGYK